MTEATENQAPEGGELIDLDAIAEEACLMTGNCLVVTLADAKAAVEAALAAQPASSGVSDTAPGFSSGVKAPAEGAELCSNCAAVGRCLKRQALCAANGAARAALAAQPQPATSEARAPQCAAEAHGMTPVEVDKLVAEWAEAAGMDLDYNLARDAAQLVRAVIAKVQPKAAAEPATGDVWIKHDDDLRFVARVLESPCPAEDIEAARKIVHGLRTTARSNVQPKGTAAGMVLVPLEPTPEMLAASLGRRPHDGRQMFESRTDLRPAIWRAMVGAAPAQAPAPAPVAMMAQRLRKAAAKLPNVADCEPVEAEMLRVARDLESTAASQAPAVAHEPLSDDAILDEFCRTPGMHHFVAAFKAGARFVERAHKIGGKP